MREAMRYTLSLPVCTAIVGCDKRRWLRELDRAPASKDGETGAAIFFHNMPLERD